jgi:hypothetical protein
MGGRFDTLTVKTPSGGYHRHILALDHQAQADAADAALTAPITLDTPAEAAGA